MFNVLVCILRSLCNCVLSLQLNVFSYHDTAVIRNTHVRMITYYKRFTETEKKGVDTVRYLHRRFIHKGDTSTHAQGTDPSVALGA